MEPAPAPPSLQDPVQEAPRSTMHSTNSQLRKQNQLCSFGQPQAVLICARAEQRIWPNVPHRWKQNIGRITGIGGSMVLALKTTIKPTADSLLARWHGRKRLESPSDHSLGCFPSQALTESFPCSGYTRFSPHTKKIIFPTPQGQKDQK